MGTPTSTHDPQTLGPTRWTAARVRAELLDDTRRTPRYELIDARVGVPEYWVVDLDARVVERTRPGDDRIEQCERTLRWQPEGAAEPLDLDLVELFRRALGDEGAA